MTKIIAHRGASYEAPENTLIAIERGIQIGADMIEIDIQLSSDGIPVVFHDLSTSRTTNLKRLKIEKLSLIEIKALDAGSWFSKDYLWERIPTLDELLQLDFKNTFLMIELKKGLHSPATIVSAVLESVDRASYLKSSQIVIGSLDFPLVQEVHKQAPHMNLVGILDKIQAISSFIELGVKRLAINKRLITKELVKELHDQEIEVWVWTVDEKKTLLKLKDYGVDGVFCNNPREAQKILRTPS